MPNVNADRTRLRSQPMPHLPEAPAVLQRRRVLAQLDLAFMPLTVEQETAVDAICELLPTADEPNILSFAGDAERQAILPHLQTLPETRAISRLLDGHWPE